MDIVDFSLTQRFAHTSVYYSVALTPALFLQVMKLINERYLEENQA